jgi:hypothetical protein
VDRSLSAWADLNGARCVGRLLPVPVPRTKAARARLAAKRAEPPKPAKALDQSARAATMLRSARNLEFDGKFEGALGYYREIIKNYPGTPQAKEAATRVEVLDGE